MGILTRLRRALARRQLLKDNVGLSVDLGCEIIDCTFEQNNRIGRYCTLIGSRLGRFTYVGTGSTLAYTTVGRYTSIGPGVIIGSGGHPLDRGAMHPIFYLARPDLGWDYVTETSFDEFAPTKVGNDVWIGARAIIRDGVTVGDGAVIGAGAVVVKDVPPYAIVAGVPAKLIRSRFDEAAISDLIELRWWDKEEAWIRKNAANLGTHYSSSLIEQDQG